MQVAEKNLIVSQYLLIGWHGLIEQRFLDLSKGLPSWSESAIKVVLSKFNHTLIVEIYSCTDTVAKAFKVHILCFGRVIPLAHNEFIRFLEVEFCHLKVILVFKQATHVWVESTLKFDRYLSTQSKGMLNQEFCMVDVVLRH